MISWLIVLAFIKWVADGVFRMSEFTAVFVWIVIVLVLYDFLFGNHARNNPEGGP